MGKVTESMPASVQSSGSASMEKWHVAGDKGTGPLAGTLEPPSIDARFRALKRLGEGSYGVVVAAQNRESGKKVAIKKVTSFEDDQSARQLLRELRLLRHFRGHENILTIKASLLRCNSWLSLCLLDDLLILLMLPLIATVLL